MKLRELLADHLRIITTDYLSSKKAMHAAAIDASYNKGFTDACDLLDERVEGLVSALESIVTVGDYPECEIAKEALKKFKKGFK